jgi:ATP-dependent RNA helicase HelY
LLDRSFAQFLDHRHRHALSRRLDRMLALIEAWGYADVDRWELTERGILLTRIYHESDLLVAESLAAGILDDLDPPSLAGVASAFAFEVRPGRWRRTPRIPAPVAAGAERLQALAARLRDEEHAARVPRTRAPDPGFAEAAWRWARGEPLDRVLERAELAPGDFVRTTKQLIDLLRQLEAAAPGAAVRRAAAEAVTAMRRGVVADVAALLMDGEADEAASSSSSRPGVSDPGGSPPGPGPRSPSNPDESSPPPQSKSPGTPVWGE